MKVLLLGGYGFLGSSIFRLLKSKKYDVIRPTKIECNLFDLSVTESYLRKIQPDLVINSAGISGGILFNTNNQQKLLIENQLMLTNLIYSLDFLEINKFINIVSSCIYSNEITIPFNEEFIGIGKLEKTNLGYATAKLSGLKMTEILGSKPNRTWINLIASNIYGVGDSIDMKKSHVINGIISKILNAKLNKESNIEMMGNGSAIRDWLNVDELALAVEESIRINESCNLNVSSGIGISIREIAEILRDISKFKGKYNWEISGNNGSPIRVLDNSRILQKTNWQPSKSLTEGLYETFSDVKIRLNLS